MKIALVYLLIITSSLFSQEFIQKDLKLSKVIKSKNLLSLHSLLKGKIPSNSKAKLYNIIGNNLNNKFKSNYIKLKSFPLENSNIKKKSAGLAILYSVLLPGMGELYADSYESGKYFTIVDAVSWGALAGFSVYGDRQRDNYLVYAKSFGGVNPDGKDDKYFADIGFYDDVESYNREQELNRDFKARYTGADNYWKWESDQRRKEYRNLWLSSENAKNNVRFAVGALILNRLVSAINAVRLVSAYNRNLEKKLSWNVSFGVINQINLPSTFEMKFITHF